MADLTKIEVMWDVSGAVDFRCAECGDLLDGRWATLADVNDTARTHLQGKCRRSAMPDPEETEEQRRERLERELAELGGPTAQMAARFAEAEGKAEYERLAAAGKLDEMWASVTDPYAGTDPTEETDRG